MASSLKSFLTRRAAADRTPKPGLALAPEARKTAVQERGFDPYNTSGSFDRKKNWSRVGRR